MTPQEYTAFLDEGFKDSDELARLLGLMNEFMPQIVQKFGKDSMKLGAKIDLLIGGVALQHLEAAIADPAKAKEVAAFLRQHLKEKMARVL